MKVEKKRKAMRKEQTDFTFFTFAGYLSPGKASLLSTMHVSESEEQPLFDRHCLQSVKEAERKIFPLGSLRPTWVPFIPQNRLLGNSAELGAHQLSVL